jgi:phage gp29-like protein
LELAQDMELKDPHYRSVLSTRKEAITGLEVKVISASDASKDTTLAKALERDIVHNPKANLRSLIRDMFDALTKGFSVTEIIWDTAHIPWKPAAYKFRDPVGSSMTGKPVQPSCSALPMASNWNPSNRCTSLSMNPI